VGQLEPSHFQRWDGSNKPEPSHFLAINHNFFSRGYTFVSQGGVQNASVYGGRAIHTLTSKLKSTESGRRLSLPARATKSGRRSFIDFDATVDET